MAKEVKKWQNRFKHMMIYWYSYNRKDMHSFLSIMTKHRNVCAHGERFFNCVTKDSITDTLIHRKLCIPQKDGRYQMGKNDIFLKLSF